MLIISELFVVGKSTSWWRDDRKAALEMVSNAWMTTPEIQSNDIWCGLTPSWKGGGGGRKEGNGGQGRSKKTQQDQFYFLFSLCLGIITIINK